MHYQNRLFLLPILVCLAVSVLGIILWIVNARSYAVSNNKHYYSTDEAKNLVLNKSVAVFPVQATKREIQLSRVGYYSACVVSCHNTYEAADVGGPEGAEVVAVVGGRVVDVMQESTAQGKPSGASLRIEGADGLWYYYTHMRAGSVQVQTGQVVRTGQVLGVIGDSQDAQGAPPHLHFDVSTIENGFDRGVGLCSELCYHLVPPQPILRRAYQALPES